MSPSDARLICSLKIVVNPPAGADPQDVRVTVYDGADTICHQGKGNASLNLPVGLYTVRWQYVGKISEQVFRLSHPDRLVLDIQRLTPAPVPGAVDSHEYYSVINQVLDSNQTTGVPLGNPTQDNASYLHLLIRARNRESYRRGTDLSSGLRLLDRNLQPLFDLGERSRQDKYNGFLLCSLSAEPGFYFIEYLPKTKGGADLPRLFPVQLLPNWQTRLFVYQIQGCPLLESASMTLVGLTYNSANDIDREQGLMVNTAADAALAALQNNLDELPRELERALLMGKFENPLLGLLGAHFLLRHFDPKPIGSKRAKPRRSKVSPRDVLENLAYLLPDSPDVAALRFKAAGLFPKEPDFRNTPPVRYPPLLRASVEALLKEDSESVNAIDENGLLGQLTSNLYGDSPWATFRPPSKLGAFQRRTESLPQGFSFNLESSDLQWAGKTSIEENDSWLKASVKDVLLLTTRTNHDPNWSDLATDLGVPYRKMMSVVKSVKNRQNRKGGSKPR